LAFLFVVHILYAFILTLQNRKARGNNRYAVTSTPKSVEWSSKNMLVLGIVVVAFMVVHFIQFWYKMQWQEIIGNHFYTTAEGAAIPVTAGSLFIQFAFQSWWTPVVYIIGFVALWFHMNHGFWSMFQSAGWNNNTWLPRLKKISCVWTTLVIGLFIVQAGWFTYQANQGEYLYNSELKGQYKAIILEHFQEKAQEIQMNAKGQFDPEAMKQMQELQAEFQKTAQSLDALCAEPVAAPAEEAIEEPVATPDATATEADSTAVENQEQPANN
jgi:succinate dehydrogenase / fumarate reductase cytochrome b subunit